MIATCAWSKFRMSMVLLLLLLLISSRHRGQCALTINGGRDHYNRSESVFMMAQKNIYRTWSLTSKCAAFPRSYRIDFRFPSPEAFPPQLKWSLRRAADYWSRAVQERSSAHVIEFKVDYETPMTIDNAGMRLLFPISNDQG
jgi:hypothetical protein